MKKLSSMKCFKRAHKCLSEFCPFYKAAFTTQISRVRFNRDLKRKKTHQHHLFSFR